MSKRNAFANLIVSVVSNVVILILGLIIPRVLLTHYGSDTNGTINTISQIFAYVALIEAGIRQAAMNMLYKPIKENDRLGTINVMYASRRYYKNVTYIYIAIVLALAFILPVGLKSDLDYFTIFLTVLFEGAAGAVSFYYVQTPSALLSVDGKTYITSIVDLVIKILSYGIKILLAMMNLNIAWIQFGFFILSLLKIVLYKSIIKKEYPWFDYKKCTDKTLKLPNRNAFVVSELAWTVFSSTDLIVLSFFASTKASSVYSVNNMIFLALGNLLSAAYYSIYYMLGNAYYEGIEKYKVVHDTFNSLFLGALTVVMSVGVLLADSFISLYTSGVNDIQYNMFWLPVCFCVIQYLSWSRYVAGNLSGIAGYAQQVSKISLIEAIINISLSAVLVNIWGIYGVVLATILALPIKAIYTNYISDRKIMKRSCKNTLLILFVNYFIFFVTVMIRQRVVFEISNYIEFVKYGILLVALYFVIVALLNIIANHSLASTLLSMARNEVKRHRCNS